MPSAGFRQLLGSLGRGLKQLEYRLLLCSSATRREVDLVGGSDLLEAQREASLLI